MTETVVIAMPHPPASLSPNGRTNWAVRHRDGQMVRTRAYYLTWAARAPGAEPWAGAVMDIHWQYAGRCPDDDNIVARCKSGRDGIAAAGLVTDDALIRVGAVTCERVKRANQQVIVTLTRMEGLHDEQD